MYKWAVLAVAALLVLVGAVTAQDATTCNLDAARAKAVDELTVIADDDDESLATGLRTVSDDLSAAVAACSNLSWVGEGDTILEPVTISEGVYKFVLVGVDDLIGVVGTSLNDDCDTLFHNTTSASNAKENEQERDESIYKLKTDCTVIFEIDPYDSGHWMMWFERIQ